MWINSPSDTVGGRKEKTPVRKNECSVDVCHDPFISRSAILTRNSMQTRIFCKFSLLIAAMIYSWTGPIHVAESSAQRDPSPLCAAEPQPPVTQAMESALKMEGFVLCFSLHLFIISDRRRLNKLCKHC